MTRPKLWVPENGGSASGIVDANGEAYRPPDLKANPKGVQQATKVPFEEWVDPKNAHLVVTRGQIFGLLNYMLGPTQRVVEGHHRVLYTLQRRTVRYWWARLLGYLRRPQ